MKTALILMLSCASLSLAQDPKPDSQPVVVKRLASVTWDLNTHKLVWVVQKGAEVDGAFVPLASDTHNSSRTCCCTRSCGQMRLSRACG